MIDTSVIEGTIVKPIPGRDGCFATDTGQIIGRRGRALKQIINCRGYLCVATYLQLETVSRLICMAFHGPAPASNSYCCHKDDNKLNNHPSNLYWGDAITNGADKVENVHHHNENGEYLGNRKMTADKVKQMRKLYQTGEYTIKQLAELFDISRTQSSYILSYKQWVHL